MSTWILEYELSYLDVKNRVLGLHVRYCDGKTLLNHVPIEGVIIHFDTDPSEFIRRLPYSWIKRIKYLRIWYLDKYYCSIYNDKIDIPCNSFEKRDSTFYIDYYEYISGLKFKNFIYTDPPLEVRDFFKDIKPNRLIFVDPLYMSKYTKAKSICYRHCIVTPIWLLYFIASNTERDIDIEEGKVIYKRYGTLRDILIMIYKMINTGVIKYLPDDEVRYIDETYLNCLGIDVLYYGRLCKAHP